MNGTGLTSTIKIYDEDGEIGKQAEWEPETKITRIWGNMLWNMMYKQDQIGMSAERRADRLHELRNNQGYDLNSVKD